MRFQNRVVLLTGASGEIGKAVALRLAREGATLALCGRREGPLEDVKRTCEALTSTVIALNFDVREEEAMREAFDRADSLGPVDAAIAAHGVNRLAPIETMETSVWDEVIETNLSGCFYMVREAVRIMKPRGRGRIVLVSSVSGRPGFTKFPGFAAYSASKYALTGLTEVASAELAGSGLSIAMVCPAGVETELFRRTVPGGTATLKPADVASVLVDLADPSSPTPSGSIIDLQ